MKRQMISLTSKFLLGILLFTGAVAAKAQTNVNEPGETEKSSVKYLGNQDDMVLFNVAYKNPGGDKFSVIVKDQDNIQLFQRVYSDKSFEKKFKLPRADRSKITFVIRDFKGADITQSFAINVSSHYVEDIAIKKVN